MFYLWPGTSIRREEILSYTFAKGQEGAKGETRMQNLEKGKSGTGAVGKRVRVSEGLLSTIYSFRGPRSHRQVEIEIPHAYWMVDREARALRIAWLRRK